MMRKDDETPVRRGLPDPRILRGKGLWGKDLLLFSTLPSTNRWALRNTDMLRHGDVVQALEQTEGRGRNMRRWKSAAGQNLTCTLMMPVLSARKLPMTGQAAALAVCRTLRDSGIRACVKWPNDVLAERGKIAGILSEANLRAGFVAVGIGLNILMDGATLHSLGLLSLATSMLLETGRHFELDEVREALIGHVQAVWEEMGKTGLDMNEWKEHDALKGCMLEIQGTRGFVRGSYWGMDEMGRLVLLDGAGREHAFFSGDVKKVVNEFGASSSKE